MLKTTKNKTLVGLDFEAGSIAAAEVRTNGDSELSGYGIASLPSGVFHEGEVTDQEALADALKEMFSEHKLSRDVRLGVANQRVAVRTMFLPPIESSDELATAIRFQAQDGERRIEVVVVAARRDMLTSHLETMQKAGLRPVGIDLSAFGMIRALAGETENGVGPAEFVAAPALSYEDRIAAGAQTEPVAADSGPARLYCNLGDVLNLAVAQGHSCVFTRASPFGVEGIAQKLAERRSLTLEHSRQWLAHVGLDRPLEEIDGDNEIVPAAREVLVEGASKLADELRLSLQYYGAQDHALAIERIVACGPGTTIPGLVDRLQTELGQPFAIGGPQALSTLNAADRARLAVSFGLALEE